MAAVTLALGDRREAMIREALDRLPDPPDVAAARRIVVKPNVVSSLRPLAATHVDALRAVLVWLRDRGACRVTLAEGAATEATLAGFAALGYFDLGGIPGLGVDFVDLNQDEAVPLTLYTRALRPQTVRLARTLVDSDLRISVTRPKTHDTVIVTGALKNMLMGSPVNRQAGGPRWRARLVQAVMGALPARYRSIQGLETLSPGIVRRLYPSDKAAVHQGHAAVNLNLCLLARVVRPHLGVLDGLVGMEGDGPIHGRPVRLGWAAAGTDAVALDSVMAHLMGFDPARIGYLQYSARAGLGRADLAAIQVVGPPPAAVQRACAPPSTYQRQAAWFDPAVEELFRSLLAAPAESVA